jgi:superfamily I DNA/RNA helicase
MQLTNEQTKIINSRAKRIIVRAFAGTGKTSTLVEFSKARPSEKLLYIAFNKAIQLEAKDKFEKNVTVRTSHSVAYQFIGKNYRHKLEFNIKPFLIMDYLPDIVPFEERYLFSSVVIKTLKKFMASTVNTLERFHIPLPPESPEIDKNSNNKIFTKTSMSSDMANEIVKLASQIWDLMCDKNNEDIPMVHDGYLKLFQLSKPTLNYDTIMIDEGQDLNPVTMDIVLNQQSNLVLVGDTHQAIYGFRYAEDEIEKFEKKANDIFYLTRSFRFGQNIASFASTLLRVCKQETHPLLGRDEPDCIGKVDINSYLLNIARTNEKLFEICVKSILKKKDKIFFVGGVDGYHFERFKEGYLFFRGQSVKDREMQSFKNFKEMQRYSEDADDSAIKILCRIVLEYKSKIPMLVDRVKKSSVPESDANFAVSTGHKCKGLEFSRVIIQDDFPSLFTNVGKLRSNLEKQEVNLLYVAITRAKQILELNKDLKKFQKSFQVN